MNTNDIPIWQKYTLSIEEASRYFRIGEKKLRRLAEENPVANWLIMNGNRLQIKRKQFEKVIDELEVMRKKTAEPLFHAPTCGCSATISRNHVL